MPEKIFKAEFPEGWVPGKCFDHERGQQCVFSITGCAVRNPARCPLGNKNIVRQAVNVTQDIANRLGGRLINMAGKDVEVFEVEK